MAAVTNRVAASALKGQGVRVTLDSSDAGTYLAGITAGDPVTAGTSNKKGVVDSVDYYGLSFLVVPVTMDATFNGAAEGILAVGDTVTI